MATAYHPLPGELNAFRRGRNRSQTTVGLPSSPQKKRASSYYPPREPATPDDTNPFYLDHTLEDGAWRAYQPGARDVRFSEEANQYYMLSSVKPGKELPVSNAIRGGSARSRTNINRSTLSVVELEHQLALQQVTPQPWGHSSHYSQGSFGSVYTEVTPDLTPSSSFSSNYSAPIHPDIISKAGEQFARHSYKDTTSGNQAVLYQSTAQNRSRTILPTQQPATPTREASLRTVPSNASSDTLVMPLPDAQESPRGKPLPSLPPVARNGNTLANRRVQLPGGKPPIAPSMISPPCRINPVTMEPHTTHFDQALFIPANDCPSPVPSPGPNSPSIERQAGFGRDRPSTSTSEMVCEQSVWESDSDGEGMDPKSLSRKPIDTLKKVRSRVHLRVAKSAPKLQNSNNNTPVLEKFPTMPEQPPEERYPPPSRSIGKARLADIYPSAQQSLRLVPPSTTSLVPPRTPRSRQNSKDERPNIDMDRSTAAAAMQAKSRRKPPSNSPQTSLSTHGEKICTMCREERSDKALHSLTLSRQPLYKRVWESLRVLGCHGDISPPRPRKAM
ncbi:hypothetical protein ETB97_006261 [Aspergillus alliaceus]|uniref:Uncharacterized protein n=1 Tax=Petromyces alliaceus TaxID=209559 RepID=A0A8H5ZXJ4_PETAA|nr:hypothetical protein ETB97_006261 [Aspergillus burnettii]